MDYVAIDFETANAHYDSACEVGLVSVENNKIKKSLDILINPHVVFDDHNIKVHGLTEEDVKDADEWDIVFNKYYDLFNHTILVAHNAGFDMNVLKNMNYKYGCPDFSSYVVDTLALSNIMWPDLPSHKLGYIAGYLELDHNAHDGMSDASICVSIISRALKMYQASTLEELMAKVNMSMGYISNDSYISPKKIKINKKRK